MNDSPTRRIASARRVRSRWSSSRRCSSSSAIELNSLPSAANSSLPSVGTRLEKSPRPIARAAASRLWTSAWRVRETVIANAIASSRKPASAPTTTHDVLEPVARGLRHASRASTARGRRSRPRSACSTRISSPASSTSPLSGSSARASSGRDAPSTSSPCLTTTPTSAMSSSSRRERARGVDGGHDPPERLRRPGRRSRCARARRPARRRTRTAPARRAASSTRRAPALRAASSRRASIRSGFPSAIASRSASSVLTISRPAALARPADSAVEVRRDPLRLGQLRVGLALLRARDDLEQHRRHGDHRDHDDDHEEQPQPIAEGRREEVAKAHAGGGATGNLAAERVRQSQAPRLQSAFHGAPVNSCPPPLRGYSSVGRAPGSHPGGRGFESP